MRRCVLSLDATLAVVDFTVGMGAELLLTHHPLIFHGLRQVYTGTPVSELVQNGIALISAHTCFDKATRRYWRSLGYFAWAYEPDP